MRLLIARLFKLLFTFRFFRKRYYGIVFRIFQPFNLFRGVTRVTVYDQDLRIKLDLDEWIQQHIYFLGYFDHYGILFLKQNLKEGDVFFDAGANVGSFTLIAAKQVGKTGSVFAFEPVEEIYNKLNENVKLNEYSNTHAENKALFEKNTTLKLFLAKKMNLGMSSIFHHDTESGNIENVEAVKLDDYVDNHHIKQIDLIKIDIEGSEMFALKGMQRTLQKFKPKILIELKEETLTRSGQTVNDIVDFLTEAGYQKFIVDEQGNISNDPEKKPMDYYNYLFIHDFKYTTLKSRNMIEEFIIKGTEDIPGIHFNAGTGILEISGRSMPENANLIFQPAFEWAEKYINNPHSSTEVIFRLEYFSSASAKKITELLLLLEKLTHHKHKINITWFHLKDDEVMENRGGELLSLINIPFELKTM